MEIEKLLTLDAPPAQVWAMLLDPAVMGACVPGMKSIEVVSATDYLAEMHVKIAFVSARFKLRTTIAEARPPHYLRSEGTGEDASVASSLRQVSEIFLTELAGGRTDLRMKIKVDVLGRLGTFGLSVMKTKADRMWDEFGIKLAGQLSPASPDQSDAAANTSAPDIAPPDITPPAIPPPASLPPDMPAGDATGALSAALPVQSKSGWLSRLLAPWSSNARQRNPDDILIEVRRDGSVVTIHWPAQSAVQCAAWLREYLK